MGSKGLSHLLAQMAASVSEWLLKPFSSSAGVGTGPTPPSQCEELGGTHPPNALSISQAAARVRWSWSLPATT